MSKILNSNVKIFIRSTFILSKGILLILVLLTDTYFKGVWTLSSIYDGDFLQKYRVLA